MYVLVSLCLVSFEVSLLLRLRCLCMPQHFILHGEFSRVYFMSCRSFALWNQQISQLYCVQVQVVFIVMEDNVSLSDDAPVSSLLKRRCVADDDALSDTLPVSFLVKRPMRTRKAASPKVTWLCYIVWLFSLLLVKLSAYCTDTILGSTTHRQHLLRQLQRRDQLHANQRLVQVAKFGRTR